MLVLLLLVFFSSSPLGQCLLMEWPNSPTNPLIIDNKTVNDSNRQIVHDYRWLASDWTDCSVTCGHGEQQREIFCADQQSGVKVPGQFCWDSKRPAKVRKCSRGECPDWAVGDWGPCQAECGKGIRVRAVQCRAGAGGERFHDWHCGAGSKPAQEQPCWTGMFCGTQLEGGRELLGQQSAENDGRTDLDEQSTEEGEGQRNRRPRFMVGSWGQCSASCGPGIRSRAVDCTARQAISGQTLKLPDYECQGQPRPSQFQPCQLSPCPPLALTSAAGGQSSVRSLAQPFPVDASDQQQPQSAAGRFRWEHGSWGPCSASCLGGQQSAPVLCVADVPGEERSSSVHWTLCEHSSEAGPRPDELVRDCNVHSCPPHWEVGLWSSCSRPCGAGVRSRLVRCAQAVSRSGPSPIVILADEKCQGQKPPEQEPCAAVNCAPEWSPGQWSHCSVSCGRGKQWRTVDCVRRDQTGQISKTDARECTATGTEQPSRVKTCTADCSQKDNAAEFSSYSEPQSLALVGQAQQLAKARDQPVKEAEGEEEEEEERRRLTLKVGGFANLYAGTSVKVKCPHKSGDRRKLIWTKDGQPLPKSERFKVSQNGALRIFHARMEDAGIYACGTADGGQQGNVTLRFKPDRTHKEQQKGESSRSNNKGGKKGRQTEMLQRIRDSLSRVGEFSLLQRLAAVEDPAQVRVDFVLSEWAPCGAQQNGGAEGECGRAQAVQIRSLTCRLHVGSQWASVDHSICESFGLDRPPTSQPCVPQSCPRWLAAPWSPCADSRCVRQGTALQRREVRCAFGNGTAADTAAQCDRKTRPKIKRECENANCSAEWRPSIWGQCSKLCGDGGVQMRLLRCVWRGTRKPAGRNCEAGLRPAAIRACQSRRPLEECPAEEEEEEKDRENGTKERETPFRPPSAAALPFRLCEDQSRFCDIIRLFQSCDQPHILAQCCYSCGLFGQRSLANNRRLAAVGRGE